MFRSNEFRIVPWPALTAALMICTIAPLPAPAQAPEDGGEMPPMGRPAEMDAIDFMLGDWSVAVEMRMGPEAPFTATTGASTVTAVLDGCVQRMDFEADVMGMPMRGVDHTTFNRNTNRYESVWVDNMGANFTIMHGGLEGGKFVLQGENKMMGQDVVLRSTSEKRSDDELFWTMDESYDGGKTWSTTMRMTYTRKK